MCHMKQGNSVTRDLPPTGSEDNTPLSTPAFISISLFSLIYTYKHDIFLFLTNSLQILNMSNIIPIHTMKHQVDFNDQQKPQQH